MTREVVPSAHYVRDDQPRESRLLSRLVGLRLFFHGSCLLDRASIFPQRFVAGDISGRQLSGILFLWTFFWSRAVSFIRMVVAPVAEIFPCGRIMALDRNGRSDRVPAGLVFSGPWPTPSRSSRLALFRIADLAVPGRRAASPIRGSPLDHASGGRRNCGNSLRC
jgi:hypothetical protein